METDEIFRLMDMWYDGKYDQVAMQVQFLSHKDFSLFLYYLGNFYGIEEIKTLSKFIDFQ